MAKRKRDSKEKRSSNSSSSSKNKGLDLENGVKEPGPNDVISGRGDTINRHPGNVQFRRLVEKRRRVYLTSHFKREKRLIAETIVASIRSLNPPGRFLSKDSKSGLWFDIDDDKAREKASQALRENSKKFKDELEEELLKKRASAAEAESANSHHHLAGHQGGGTGQPPCPHHHHHGGNVPPPSSSVNWGYATYYHHGYSQPPPPEHLMHANPMEQQHVYYSPHPAYYGGSNHHQPMPYTALNQVADGRDQDGHHHQHLSSCQQNHSVQQQHHHQQPVQENFFNEQQPQGHHQQQARLTRPYSEALGNMNNEEASGRPVSLSPSIEQQHQQQMVQNRLDDNSGICEHHQGGGVQYLYSYPTACVPANSYPMMQVATTTTRKCNCPHHHACDMQPNMERPKRPMPIDCQQQQGGGQEEQLQHRQQQQQQPQMEPGTPKYPTPCSQQNYGDTFLPSPAAEPISPQNRMRLLLDQALTANGPTAAIPGLEQLFNAGENNLQGYLNETSTNTGGGGAPNNNTTSEEKTDFPFSPMTCTFFGNGSTLMPRRRNYEARMA